MAHIHPNISISSDSGRLATIFFVDVNDYMHEVDPTDDKKRTYFEIALKAIRNEMNAICCAAEHRQVVGLVFFNCGKTNVDSEAVDHVYLYRLRTEADNVGFLRELNAESVQHLDEWLYEAGERQKLLKETLGGSALCDYSQLLWFLQRTFKHWINAQKKLGIVYTRNAFLKDYDTAALKKASIEATNVTNAGIRLSHFLLGDEEADDVWTDLEVEAVPFHLSTNLGVSLMRRNIAMRALASIPFNLGPNVGFAVKLYHLAMKQTIERGEYLDERTNERLELKTRVVKKEEAEKEPESSQSLFSFPKDATEKPKESQSSEPGPSKVDHTKLKQVKTIGGVQVKLDAAELAKMKRVTDDRGLHIIGFKPASWLKPYHIRASSYMFPDEESINGSSVLYKALFRRCLERNVIALARLRATAAHQIQLVALVPQRRGGEVKSEEGEEPTDVEDLFYEGFHVFDLPYAEEYREVDAKIENEVWSEPKESIVEAAGEFVDKLTTSFTPLNFFNPNLQKHYWAVEAAATRENPDYPEHYDFDQIKPHFKASRRAQDVTKKLHAEFDNA
uniref:Ku domain-containing protein n=1 Tax=Panagrellus redivivus TaxID=6233 RepID=A0A7E4VK85_PANRE